MSAGILEEIVAGRLRGMPRMNAEQFEQYLEQVLAGENVHCELLDGYPVLKDTAATGGDPMIMGARHALIVDALNNFLIKFVAGSAWSVKCQTPIRLNSLNRPEPDLAVISGRSSDYAPGYPGPEAVLLIIEVADSSLEADRIAKSQRYAAAGIPAYWIVNLRDDQLEVYTQPNREHEGYSNRHLLYEKETVTVNFPGLPASIWQVREILDGTI